MCKITEKGIDLFSEIEEGLRNLALDPSLNTFALSPFQLFPHRSMRDPSHPVRLEESKGAAFFLCHFELTRTEKKGCGHDRRGNKKVP